MSNLHEVVFKWPYTAKEAIVTGSFDKWACSLRMNRGPSGFIATVRVPWQEKVLYKFIVDGKWTTIDQAPTETDWRGNINNVYYAPTKPKEPDTPRYDPPVAQKSEIPTPSTKPTAKPDQPAKDETSAVGKEPSSGVGHAPVVPVNDSKPVDTPPAKPRTVVAPNNVPVILPTPANLKAPLPIVPVNDATTADKQPPVVEPPRHTDSPSTHALPVNSPRKASVGTSSSNTLSVEKKEDEELRPEVEQPNGTTNNTVKAEESAHKPPATPVKDKTPSSPTTPTSPTIASPPTTPKKGHFPGSASSTPTSSPNHSLSRKGTFKKKRDSIIHKVKHLFTPEKEKKEHHREKSHSHEHE